MTDYFEPDLTAEQIGAISNLGLAHLGDAVYELMVRTWLCRKGRATAKGLHRAAVAYVAAPAQAQAAQAIIPLLGEEELTVFRRGRNAKTNSIPQAASREQYQTATAVEALFGWLYLQGRRARLNELFEAMMEGD